MMVSILLCGNVYGKCTSAMIRADECTMKDMETEQKQNERKRQVKLRMQEEKEQEQQKQVIQTERQRQDSIWNLCKATATGKIITDTEYNELFFSHEIIRIKNHDVNIGDSFAFMVCAKGFPLKKHSTKSAYSVTHYFYYSDITYVMEDGKITLIVN